MPKAINVDPYVVFNAFAQHCHGNRTETGTFLLSNIRQSHQSDHVTEVSEGQVSLIEFAEAGLATAVPIQPSYATREWCTDEKKIEDHFRYVRYQYTWDSKEYIVYMFW
jgi:hypothetical protein